MVEITMFYSRDEIIQEMNRIAEQEQLRGRTLTTDEIIDLARDITEPTTKD